MRRVTAALLLAGVLTGCASQPSESPWLVQRDLSTPKRCEPLTADQELVLGVSQEMATAGRRHAALANLERLPNTLPQVRLSKARLLRLLGHGGEAEALYAGLLNTCLVADGHHGLGQLAASRGNNATAQEHLRAAASLSPANDAIRNDLGVVYLNQRQLSEARFELLTAMELNEGAKRAPINLLTLLVYQGDWQTARDLVRNKGLSADEFGRAEERARVMRREDVAPVDAAVSASAVAAATPVATPVRDLVEEPARAAVPVAVPVRTLVVEPAQTAAPMSVSAAARVWALEEAAPAGSAANQTGDAQPTAGARPVVCRSSGADGARLSIMECLQNER